MIRFYLPALCVLLLTACISAFSGPDIFPTRAEIVGNYYMGHTGFDETLELHQDGSYTRTLLGHLRPSATFLGTWRMEGKYLFFEPVPANPSISSLISAEVFFYKHSPAFVRTQDLKRGKVGEWWVYQRDLGK